jgi:hypothetical protein
VKLSIEFECGLTTCASKPGHFCRFLSMGRSGINPQCTAFDLPLFSGTKPYDGWLKRCKPCQDLTPIPEYLTANEAADLLNVSARRFLSDVAPELRSHESAPAKYSRSDVLAWKERCDQLREEALNELAAMSQEMGLWDE